MVEELLGKAGLTFSYCYSRTLCLCVCDACPLADGTEVNVPLMNDNTNYNHRPPFDDGRFHSFDDIYAR